jgi:histidine triad (HIT) family protein
MNKNIFEKIRDGEEKADIVYQDNYITAFKDIEPNAPVHILIIPNKKITSLNEIQEEDSNYLSNILLGAKQIAKQFNVNETGYRLITNCGKDGGQEINYLHFHLVGGLKLGKMISLSKSEKKKFNDYKSNI